MESVFRAIEKATRGGRFKPRMRILYTLTDDTYSHLLFEAFIKYERKFPYVEIEVLFVDEGLGRDINSVRKFCEELDLKLNIVSFRDVFNVDLQHLQGSWIFPDKCFLCRYLKRLIMVQYMKNNGFDIVILGTYLERFIVNSILNLMLKPGIINIFNDYIAEPFRRVSLSDIRKIADDRGIKFKSFKCPLKSRIELTCEKYVNEVLDKGYFPKYAMAKGFEEVAKRIKP